MKKLIHKLVICPLSLLLFIGFFQIGKGEIFCIGEDGQIKVESICMPCCSDEVDSCLDDETTTNHFEHEESTDCSDLTVEYASLNKNSERKVNIKLLKTSLKYYSHISNFDNIFVKNNINLLKEIQPPLNNHTESIKSVILIC